MKFEIETYKGQTIEYDDDYDKFCCDISIEDKYKQTKRLSLKDIRKEIDSFIKLNADFKPFKAIFLSEYGDKDFSIKNVESIRTDGKFIISEESKYKSHYGKKQMKKCMVYDVDIVNEKQRLSKQLEAARKIYDNGVKELCKKLQPVDLSKFEHIMSPAD